VAPESIWRGRKYRCTKALSVPTEQDDEQKKASGVGTGYPGGQLARAFVTAAAHEDADTRRRAEERVRRRHDVLAGMADGTLTVGSRTPVAGLPAWVTPGISADRQALFTHWLTNTASRS
jgi:hypothetical protein